MRVIISIEVKKGAERVEKMKYKDLTGKYNSCGDARKTCEYGGNCVTCAHCYPGNAAISGKPDNYKDVCMMSRKSAKEIYDKATENAVSKIVEEDKKAGKGFLETGIPFASPRQEKEALAELGYTPDDLLAMDHDAVLGEVLRQLNIGSDEWEPIDYEKLEREV